MKASDIKTVIMHGREVRLIRVGELHLQSGLKLCADCNAPSEFVVIERERPPRGFPSVWGWCGECDIGG